MALVHPLKHRLSKRWALCYIAAIWVLALICGLPNYLGSKVNYLWFYDEIKRHAVLDVFCAADNFPDGNAVTSQLFKA